MSAPRRANGKTSRRCTYCGRRPGYRMTANDIGCHACKDPKCQAESAEDCAPEKEEG